MSEFREKIWKGTLILTSAALVSRVIGFFYKIFLSHSIGAEQIGIYQLAVPLYALTFALCVTGIQSALSRLISACFAREQPRRALDTFASGLLMALLLSLGSAFLLYRAAAPLSSLLLKEPRCAALLRLLALSLPFSCLHACITAYYYGRKRAGIPALGQLLEQGVRTAASLLCYFYALEKGLTPTAALAAAGALAGELAACLFSLLLIRLEFSRYQYALRELSKPFSRIREILALSVPLTINHVFVTVLHNAEAILIPGMLLASGLTRSSALSLYGILTGMTLPLLFFPSAVTHSLAVMLLPSVAEDQARGNQTRIRRTVESAFHYCMILGIFAGGVFFFFGSQIGSVLFGVPEAGGFLKDLAPLCPFLYLNGTLSGILNGLGKTRFHLAENAVSLGLRILFVLLAVPRLGIRGCLAGLVLGEVTSALMNLCCLRRLTRFRPNLPRTLLKPAAAFFLSLGICLFFSGWGRGLFAIPTLAALLLKLILLGLSYLLFFPEEWKKYLFRNSTSGKDCSIMKYQTTKRHYR